MMMGSLRFLPMKKVFAVFFGEEKFIFSTGSLMGISTGGVRTERRVREGSSGRSMGPSITPAHTIPKTVINVSYK
jgi:hypothetical protein